MVETTNTSWQQRYSTPEIYTLRCRIVDEPGMFGKLSEAIGSVGGRLGEIRIVGLEPKHKIRDVGVYFSSKSQVDQLVESLKGVKGVELLGVVNETLEIHRRGVIEMVSRVKIESLTALRMVYTPGVAQSCEVIADDESLAWEYTGICDRVAIVTNGTAVLGLGDIGVMGSLPVMEGKAAIFSEFVGISGVPILIESHDVDTVVETVVRISKGFGAIQLEDISAPECFAIEEKLRARLDKPVFHDDQHGTATVVLAALINALKQVGKNSKDCSVVMLGAGAAGIAISEILMGYGFGDIVLCDSRGPLYPGRGDGMNEYKERIAGKTNKDNLRGDIAECFKGRDVFIGVARPNMVSSEMVASMNSDAIVLPLSNPVGEITKEEAIEAGAAIAADGRDVNNALAYPGIFRGALDARAKAITLNMQMAAAKKLAELADEGQLLPSILDREVHRQAAKAVKNAWAG